MGTAWAVHPHIQTKRASHCLHPAAETGDFDIWDKAKNASYTSSGDFSHQTPQIYVFF